MISPSRAEKDNPIKSAQKIRNEWIIRTMNDMGFADAYKAAYEAGNIELAMDIIGACNDVIERKIAKMQSLFMCNSEFKGLFTDLVFYSAQLD